jgi:hypothetical protein
MKQLGEERRRPWLQSSLLFSYSHPPLPRQIMFDLPPRMPTSEVRKYSVNNVLTFVGRWSDGYWSTRPDGNCGFTAVRECIYMARGHDYVTSISNASHDMPSFRQSVAETMNTPEFHEIIDNEGRKLVFLPKTDRKATNGRPCASRQDFFKLLSKTYKQGEVCRPPYGDRGGLGVCLHRLAPQCCTTVGT